VDHLNSIGWHHEGDYGLIIPSVDDHR
jgi:hypothetical protein